MERLHIAPSTTRMSWFVYVVCIRPPAGRTEVMHKLDEADVPSRPYFTPIHLQPFYRETFGYQRGDFPVTESLGDVCLTLPLSPVAKEEQVDTVCTELRSAVSQALSSRR